VSSFWWDLGGAQIDRQKMQQLWAELLDGESLRYEAMTIELSVGTTASVRGALLRALVLKY